MEKYYQQQHTQGMQLQFWQIQQWVNKDIAASKNKPLLIQGQVGVGKKSLINRWKEYHISKNKNDIVLIHFATAGGSNANYFFAIYRTLIKLRELLNISQKVQLHEQKLRRYLSYWLQVVDRSIQTQAINNLEQQYQKVILIFEGVNYFIDRQTQRENNISFWLPQTFPSKIKIIITANTNSLSSNYLKQINCDVINLSIDRSILLKIMNQHMNKNTQTNQEIKRILLNTLQDKIDKLNAQCLFVKTFLTTLLPKTDTQIIKQAINRLDVKQLIQINNLNDLLDFVISFWSKFLCKNQKCYGQMLCLLINTQKGLLMSQILKLTQCTQTQINQLTLIFSLFIINYNGLYMIKNQTFKNRVRKKYTSTITHLQIAQSINKSSISVRKLQQQCYHLFHAKRYFDLKQLISQVENFLLLFNRHNKYDLCRYWQRLQQNNLDPVNQYNKAIQGLQMHYHPSSQDLFRIIVQISRFLKQFSDFQTQKTPQFRHPKIIGGVKQLQEICMLQELKALQLCQASINTQDNSQSDIIPQSRKQFIRDRVLKKMQRLFTRKRDKRQQFDQSTVIFRHKKNIQTYQIYNSITMSNMDVPSNRKRFRQYFEHKVLQFLQKHNLFVQKQQQQQQQDIQRAIKKIDFVKLQQKQFYDQQLQSKNYYYKRWIWMQFPWVCISLKQDYSGKLKQCFTSPTKYMTVKQQSQFTNQSLKIALQAKQRRQLMFKQRQTKQTIIHQKTENTKILKSKSKKLGQKTTMYNSFNYNKAALQKMIPRQKLRNRVDSNEKIKPTFLTQLPFQSAQQLRRNGSLPTIRSALNQDIMRDLKTIQQSNLQLRKRIDELSHRNTVMSRRLKELQTIELNQNMHGNYSRKAQQCKQQIKLLNDSIQHSKYKYCYSLLQKQRLNILIRICKHNKTRNQQFLKPLNYQANNFKKIISIQQENIQQVKRSTQFNRSKWYQLSHQQQQIQQKQSNQKLKIQWILKQHDDFQQRFMQFGDIYNQSYQENHQIQLPNDKNQTQLQKMKSSQDLTILREKFQQVKKYINLENDAYLKQPDFIKFKDRLDKQHQLQGLISVQNEKIKYLKKQLQQRKQYLSVLVKANEGISCKGYVKQSLQKQKVVVKEQPKKIYHLKSMYNKLIQIRLKCQGAGYYINQSLKGQQSEINISKSLTKLKQLIQKLSTNQKSVIQGSIKNINHID